MILFGAAAYAQAPTYTVLIAEGDQVGTVGLANAGFSDFADHLAINNSGDWIIFLDTDNADSNLDGAVIQNGTVILQDSDQAPGAPVGETLNIASFT